MDNRTEVNNVLILDALATHRLRTNPGTGQVWLDDELMTDRMSGYIRFTMDGHLIGAHRVVWHDAHGRIPLGYWINHRNGTRADNRIVNLEVVTPRQNRMHAADSWWPTPFIRGEDIEAVAETRPDWLARVASLASDPNVTPEQVAELRAEARAERSEYEWAFPSGSILRTGRG